MVCFSLSESAQYPRERVGDVYCSPGVNSGVGGPLASPSRALDSTSLVQNVSPLAQDPDLFHSIAQSSQQPLDTRLHSHSIRTAGGGPHDNLSFTPDEMLATEQPVGSHPHDLNHNERERGGVANRAERYLLPQRINDFSSYDVVDRKQDNKPKNAFNKTFPNGFPNFNNFRNNPQGFYDNFCYDAGYASEKSPEEEEAPTVFDIETLSSSRDGTRTTQSKAENNIEDYEDDDQEYDEGEGEDDEEEEEVEIEMSLVLRMLLDDVEPTTQALINVYPFINEGTMFDVTVEKNSRGLGMALCGGCETKGPYSGLIRIKKLYPQMPAWLCGQLQQGDIVLEANEVILSGLASHEAREVLRTTKTSGVHLLVCRPPAGAIDDPSVSPTPDMSMSGISTVPEVVSTSMLGSMLSSPNHLAPSPVQSMCGEFEICLTKVKGSLGFTLRKRDNSVLGHTIRTLVREPALSDGRIKPGDKILSVNATDLCGLSHEEAIAFLRTTPETVTIRLYRDVSQTPVSPLSPSESDTSILKPKPLRQEARDMLSDLAFRKRSSPSNSPSINGSHSASPGNPRRRRLQKTPTPDVNKVVVADRFDSLVRRIERTPEGTGSEDQVVAPVHMRSSHEFSSITNRGSCTSSTSRGSTIVSRNTSNASTDTNSLSESSENRRKRPNFLDLDNRQSCPRKTQFTPPHEIGISFPSPLSSSEHHFLSMDSVDSAPQIGSTQSVSPSFAHVQPAYQSVNFGNLPSHNEHNRLTGTASDYNISSYMTIDNKTPDQKSGLLKWKGIILPPEEEENPSSDETDADDEETDDCQNQKSHRMKEVTIGLHRGWNARLGFSLQSEDNVTKVVAIYSGCVASKDGRLKIGDQILKVNGDDVTSWDTERIIDLLRKTTGRINLTVLQQPF